VIAAGPGRHEYTTGVKLPMSVQVGQSVLYRAFDPTKVKLDNEEHAFIRDEEVLLTYSGDKLTLESAMPTLDHVLIRVERPDTTTSSGIVTSTGEGRAPSQGEVVKVGPGGRKPDGQLLPMQVAAGDRVKFREHMGIDVKIDGVDYIVCSIAEILCKLN
jgi:chaperonin GroES